ncbi:MAG: cob(I)yrinic acid a,c-diamide adenosyltransferase, partial [Clostridiales bacterium]|nr:cob(I)yrinic acid a,c-diamide adenosyltransferase [Clostridiales bacterium]
LKEIESILKSDDFNIVILDEINIALHYNLLNIDNVIDILNKRNENIEVVLTGRNAPEKIIEFADLVTEMKEIKHYYNSGVDARIGIEK